MTSLAEDFDSEGQKKPHCPSTTLPRMRKVSATFFIWKNSQIFLVPLTGFKPSWILSQTLYQLSHPATPTAGAENSPELPGWETKQSQRRSPMREVLVKVSFQVSHSEEPVLLRVLPAARQRKPSGTQNHPSLDSELSTIVLAPALGHCGRRN